MSLNVPVLSQSFECIKPDGIEFAACFYTNLFADYPQLKSLFANTNMPEQENKLLSAIVLVIENLRQPDLLTNPLNRFWVVAAYVTVSSAECGLICFKNSTI